MFFYLLLLVVLLPLIGVGLFLLSLNRSERRVILNALYIAFHGLKAILMKLTVDQLWDAQFEQQTNKSKNVFYYVDDKVAYTWQQVEDYSNQLSHFLLSKNAQAKQTIALMMENRPQFFWSWLGIAKIGCSTALINHNLRQTALLHALRTSAAEILIFDLELTPGIEEVLPTLKSEFPNLLLCCVRNIPSSNESVVWPNFALALNEELKNSPVTKVPDQFRSKNRGITAGNVFLYVYTSGTTGPSKAAKISHMRFITGCAGAADAFRVTPNDIVYVTLPLYHSAASIIGTGTVLFRGTSVVVRKKFSASKFIDDVREYNATIVQYIGEICRYLVNSPARENEKNHKIRLAVGNGLRPDVWKEFQQRYNIPQMGEFYAATEGPVGLLNLENKFGAIGYASPKVLKIVKAAIVKFDVETESVVRDSNGRCIRAAPNETGEFICQVINVLGVTNFAGYTNAEATQKKLYTDVFEKGDKWFRSGDLLKADEEGWAYFVDRIGDTFRWKGENCATSEIAEVLATFPSNEVKFHEISVYGVSIPGKDGRAGMACIAINDKPIEQHEVFTGVIEKDEETKRLEAEELKRLIEKIDFDGLIKYLKQSLPVYAVPLFLRFVSEMPRTSTFKHMKVQLRDEGFNPSTIHQPMWFLDLNSMKYVPLTTEIYQQVIDGTAKV